MVWPSCAPAGIRTLKVCVSVWPVLGLTLCSEMLRTDVEMHGARRKVLQVPFELGNFLPELYPQKLMTVKVFGDEIPRKCFEFRFGFHSSCSCRGGGCRCRFCACRRRPRLCPAFINAGETSAASDDG